MNKFIPPFKFDLTLADNPFAGLEDKADAHIPTATLNIYSHLFDSAARKKDTNTLRASAANYCFKRRWYQRKGYDGIALAPRKWVNFLLGDLSERVMLHLIKEALVGPSKLYSEVSLGECTGSFIFDNYEFKSYKQKTVTTEIGKHTISGHADGWGKRNTDGGWELIEIKSSANWGYKEFCANGPAGYEKQSHILMLSDEAKKLGVNQARFFYLRKETGHIWDRVLPFDSSMPSILKEEFDLSEGEIEPKAPYELVEIMKGRGELKVGTGVFKAEFPCSYCPFITQCHGENTIAWNKNQWGHLSPTFTFVKGDKK